MPPKKDGKKKAGGGKKKAGKPSWMSDALWDLSNNLPKLSEFYSGDIKETKLKEGQAPPPTITRTQAGMYIWQLLFPPNKAGKQKREESVKLQIVETSVKILASGKAPDMTPALGILVAMTQDNPIQRGIMLDAKPAPLPHVLNALTDESASLRSVACALLRVVARESDSRPRLWRLMRGEFDWGPLVACLDLTEMSQLGGRSACFDAAAAMEALCCAPEQDIANGSCNALLGAKAMAHLVKVLRTRNAHPMAKACCVAVLNQLLRRASPAQCEELAAELSGLEPLTAVFGHPVIPLSYKAHTAACLLRYVMPDSIWRATAAAAAAAKAAAAGNPPGTAGTVGEGAGEDMLSPPGTAGGAGAGADLQLAVTRGLESAGGVGLGGLGGEGGPGGGMEGVPDVDLLDDETREQVVRRARGVAALPGVLRSLVQLCVGPEGPLPDLEAVKDPADAPAEDDGKKKKKKGKKGKKKAKMEPGMAEAQMYASAVLRLVSLAEDQRAPLAEAGCVRYLLPLLDAKGSAARWNARQTLINLSMSPDLLPKLQLYKVPDYVHQANVPQTHFERPAPKEQGAPPGQLLHQDSLTRKREGSAGTAGGNSFSGGTKPPTAPKPPALKIK